MILLLIFSGVGISRVVMIVCLDSCCKVLGLLGGWVFWDVDYILVVMFNVSNRFEYEVLVVRMNLLVLVYVYGYCRCCDVVGFWLLLNWCSCWVFLRLG